MARPVITVSSQWCVFGAYVIIIFNTLTELYLYIHIYIYVYKYIILIAKHGLKCAGD